jgi:integrase/recombinase XerD
MILNSCANFKHYTMLSLMFYCMLRIGDVINLEDDDINLSELSLRIRDGKFGKSAILPIPPECAKTLEQYLQVRPRIQIDGKYYVFYTDRLNKWSRRSAEQMFKYHKDKAGVTTPGSVHVWGRHSPASIMVKHGCDVYSLQQLMRHSSIKTTARYLHTDITTLREKQNRYLDI